MAKHGNSNENEAEHHLYEIRDRRLGVVYKYGICGKPLLKDGTSPRANEQVNYLNRAMQWSCFFAEIVLIGIPGRATAKQVENEYIACPT
jgi:hypothetical protein